MIPVIFIDKKKCFFESDKAIEEFDRRIREAIDFAFHNNIFSGDLEFVDASVNINLIKRPVISSIEVFLTVGKE